MKAVKHDAFGRKLIGALESVRDQLRSGEKTTAREVTIRPPRGFVADDVKKLRDRLNLSQAAFAALLGADVQSVRFWEQGRRNPSGVACRLMEEFARQWEEDADFAAKRLRDRTSDGDSSAGPPPPLAKPPKPKRASASRRQTKG
ncbi:MAG TPA: helix-turn-helix domain-containing protein [Planctomycetia bacterium]|nr:helix-turn-helix domain-containing protein [Planctomycetia bacterium]